MPSVITPVFQDDYAIHLDTILKNISDEEFFEQTEKWGTGKLAHTATLYFSVLHPPALSVLR